MYVCMYVCMCMYVDARSSHPAHEGKIGEMSSMDMDTTPRLLIS